MSVASILKSIAPDELISPLLDAYKEIEVNFSARRWKASELDAGHFVEVVRRIIDFQLTGTYLPIGRPLPALSDQELRRYEQALGHESLRLLIPRLLKAVYNIRNKRGVGHIGEVSPNEMDSTLILYSCKWVLGELVRLAAGSSGTVDDAQRAVESIMERRLDLIWKSGDVRRVLNTRLTAREQVLVLLYDQNLTSEDEIRELIEYRNPRNFRQILKRLHADRLIEYSAGRPLAITSKGVIEAEGIILLERQPGPPPRSVKSRLRNTKKSS